MKTAEHFRIIAEEIKRIIDEHNYTAALGIICTVKLSLENSITKTWEDPEKGEKDEG